MAGNFEWQSMEESKNKKAGKKVKKARKKKKKGNKLTLSLQALEKKKLKGDLDNYRSKVFRKVKRNLKGEILRLHREQAQAESDGDFERKMELIYAERVLRAREFRKVDVPHERLDYFASKGYITEDMRLYLSGHLDTLKVIDARVLRDIGLLYSVPHSFDVE